MSIRGSLCREADEEEDDERDDEADDEVARCSIGASTRCTETPKTPFGGPASLVGSTCPSCAFGSSTETTSPRNAVCSVRHHESEWWCGVGNGDAFVAGVVDGVAEIVGLMEGMEDGGDREDGDENS